MDFYTWVQALHVIAVITWMAGMLYLPRLYVYHADAPVGSPQSETFKVMERRLLRFIMNPAMIATWVLGLGMVHVWFVDLANNLWLVVKLVAVVGLSAAHGIFAKWRKMLAADERPHSARTYRIANEVPTLLMIVIVIMVVVKPF